MENSTDMPKIGEHHPDGSVPTPDKRNKSDALNFGWFSLPPAKRGISSRNDEPNTPAEVDRGFDNKTICEGNQRPLSKEEHRPDSQQRATPQHYAPPGEDRSYDRIPEPQHCLEEPGITNHGCHEQDYGRTRHNTAPVAVHDDIVNIDWPISSAARTRIPSQQPMYQYSPQPRTPVLRSEIPGFPPTPLPPLQWQGYQNCSRPTYSSWHNNCYQNRDVIPPITKRHGMDANNSNLEKSIVNKNADTGKNGRDKTIGNKKQRKSIGTKCARNENNNNNNDDLCDALTLLFNNQLVARNNIADGNNNNWMTVENQGSATTQVTTIPPYEQSDETVPNFYSPNVVMKWEDADGQSEQEKQSFKHNSLMKRIRSSIFQMWWSILPCVKNQENESATQSCKSFKYDRFDYNKYRRNEQGDHK